jgi:Undecaprenyl-phosphate glucose phosphotransferase
MLKYELKTAMAFINLIWLFLLFSTNPIYRGIEYTSFEREINSISKSYTAHFLLFSLVEFFINTPKSDEFFYWLLRFYGLFLVTLFLGRLFLKTLFDSYSKAETVKYIVVGYSKALNSIEKALSEEHLGRIQYLGYFSKNNKKEQNYLGEIDGIYDYLKVSDSNLILCAPDEIPVSKIEQLMQYAKHNFIDFKVIPLEIEMFTSGISVEVHNGFPLLSAKNEKITRIRYKLLKRCFDIVFSLFVIVFILSWLYPLIALLIKWESKGPVLFLQKRIGYQNQSFICFKFRSMVVHAETGKVTQASKNDPRLTKIGAFIRRHNIDEMPQFFNVLLGNMSVVGPRPHAVPHDIQYKNTMEDYILRHYAKPGITGWAQVNGWRGPTDTRQKIVGRAEHDIWYIRNWSFLLDLEIIWRTIISKQSKLNAY